MKTAFSAERRADPGIAACEAELRRCVHCGFCTATCPTYVLDGNELDSPRGRITLIQAMLEQGGAPDPDTVVHIDRCLSCLGCVSTCPSGVNYARLIDEARQHIARHHRRRWPERLLRRALAGVLPRPAIFRAALGLGRMARPLAALLPGALRPMVALVPDAPATLAPERAGIHPARGTRRLRVALLAGCVQDSLRPEINDATIRVLTALGVEVVVPERAGCCGALVHHLGYETQARAQAERLVAAWQELHERDGVDHVVVNASGCGTLVKDYGFLLRGTPCEAAAARLAAATLDVVELIARLDPEGFRAPRPMRLAYQSACSLQHGQKIDRMPRELLERAGYEVVALADGHLCCGSAGTYNMLQPAYAQRLKALKQEAIRRAAPQGVASGNIGCLTHLAPGLDVPAAHTIEWLDWALGGPKPAALARHDERS